MIYAALFCLEYGYSPKNIRTELRIYQDNEANEIPCWIPNPDDIIQIMQQMTKITQMIKNIEEETEK